MKVLVVDDEKDWRTTLQTLLKFEGIECVAAANADEARSCIESGDCDLIVMDLMMPGNMNGWEFLEWKAGSPYRGTPVVVCSGYSDVDIPQAPCVKMVLVKPPEDIIKAIKSLLPK